MVMIGFLVQGRVRIKIRMRVMVRVRVMFNVSSYQGRNHPRNKRHTFSVEQPVISWCFAHIDLMH